MTTDQPKPRRRFFRYSLRTLLIVVTVFCVWVAMESSRARRQQAAVERVYELGGDIFFGYRFTAERRPVSDPLENIPDWLVKAVGEDYFRRVVTVNFSDQKGAFSTRASREEDANLAALDDLPDLRELLLSRNQSITDDDLAHTAHLKYLRVITLAGTSIEGPGLRHIGSLQTLEGLQFDDTPLTDAGLAHLKDLSRLKWLLLDRTKITDQGLSHLTSLTSLETLNASGTGITDDGLKHLGNMTGLTWLSLGGTKVTDAGLKHLHGMTGLKNIFLDGTDVTRAGLKSLQQALPNCKIANYP